MANKELRAATPQCSGVKPRRQNMGDSPGSKPSPIFMLSSSRGTGGERVVTKTTRMSATDRQATDQSQLLEFCGRTTLRVLPRLKHTGSHRHRVFWLSVFICLLIGALICTAFIVRAYLVFRTRVDLSTKWRQRSPFPSVTICPHHPLSRRGLRILRNQHNTPGAWAEKHLRGFFMPKFSFTYFYSTLPNRTFANTIGRRQDEFIFNCKANPGVPDLNSDAGFWWNCQKPDWVNLTIKRITNSEHFNCYMFTFTDLVLHHANGLFMALNLENYRTVNDSENEDLEEEAKRGCAQCSYSTPLTWKHGARIAIHAPNTWPDLSEEGHDLAVGSVHDIRFRSQLRKLMRPPHGVCGTGQQTKRIYRDKGNDFGYSPTVCKKHYFQAVKKEYCGCVDAYFPVEDQDEPSGNSTRDKYVFCSNQHFMKLMKEKKYKRCNREIRASQDSWNCPPLCEQFHYRVKFSSSYGFHKSVLTRLYKDLRKSGVINSPIPEMESVLHLTQRGNYSQALRELSRNTGFMDNFLLISVLRSDYSLAISTEEASFTLTSLLSMLGGISSLFIGFNLFVIIEFCELGLMMMKRLCSVPATGHRGHRHRRTKSRDPRGVERPLCDAHRHVFEDQLTRENGQTRSGDTSDHEQTPNASHYTNYPSHYETSFVLR